MKKGNKKRIKFRGIIFLLLLFYLIGMLGYYVLTLPIKRIIINGENLLTEQEIIELADIDTNLPLYKLQKHKIIKNLKSNKIINDVKLTKSILGNIKITIKENKILFYDSSLKKLVLSNSETIDYNEKYLGYPVLNNYVQSDIYETFIKKFSAIDVDVIKMISEIEYSPDKYNGTIIDEERFLLRMNDGNRIYINNVNIEQLNRYHSFTQKIEGTGVFQMDGSLGSYIFKKDK